jgi:hypothetical protein
MGGRGGGDWANGKKDAREAVFRIHIRLIRLRIQPKISMRIQIPDPDIVKFIEIVIFSLFFIGKKSLLLLVFVDL